MVAKIGAMANMSNGLNEKILITTIVRNRGIYLNRYYIQLKKIVQTFPECDFYLSIYENDSTDNTKKLLKEFNWSFFKKYSIVCEDIKTPYFGSHPIEERVKNLADARNKCLIAKNLYLECNKILMIDSDIRFESLTIRRLLNFQKRHRLDRVDIVSGIALHEDLWHWDTWGTRRNQLENRGGLFIGWENREYDRYYGTSNGLCLYNAEPFKKGVRYGWFNTVLNTFDCEMIVVCQEFHKLKYDKIYIDYKAVCYHGEKSLVKNEN